MCVLIDPGCISKVFNTEDSQHEDFEPVLKWIRDRRGRIVFGGSKYITELKNVRKYWRIVVELDKARSVNWLPNQIVDEVAEKLKEIESGSGFDDEHLVAIVRVSGCTVVCTADMNATQYLKKKELYTRSGVRAPRIYSRKRNQNLLHQVRCPLIP